MATDKARIGNTRRCLRYRAKHIAKHRAYHREYMRRYRAGTVRVLTQDDPHPR